MHFRKRIGKPSRPTADQWAVGSSPALLLLLGLVALSTAAGIVRATAATTRPAHVQPPTLHNQTSAPGPLSGWPVARVELRGNLPSDRTTILNQIRVSPGAAYHRALVNVDVRSIASLGRFKTVKAEIIPTANHQVIVRYIVQERPRIKAVEIVGNRHVKDRALHELILAKVGGAIDPFIFHTDMRAIRDLYRRKGFLFARVKLDKKALGRGVVRYEITEGPKVVISSVRFIGNIAYPSWYMHFKAQTSSHFWFIRQGLLDYNDLNTDLTTFRRLYVKRGYLDCRVAYHLKFSPNLRHVVVEYIIHAGTRYRIGWIHFHGNTVFSTPFLMSKIRLKSGTYWNQDLIEAAKHDVADVYGRAGYIYSHVVPKFGYSRRPGIANLTFYITQGLSYHVGRVIIRGNTQVQDHVVRRALRMYPGRLYDTVAVRHSISRIKDTQLFPHATITPVGNEPETRNALVSLQQGQTGRFMVGAGVSTSAGLLGQVSFSQQNFDITAWPHSLGELMRGQAFKGNGQFFQVLLEPGTQFQLYKVTFAEPYLWDSPYSFRNSAYYFTEIFNSYDLDRAGDRITLGRRFGNHIQVTTAFRVEEVGTNNVTDVGPPGFDPNEPDSAPEIFAQQGMHLLTSIKPGIVYDTTNSTIFPTRGVVAGASLEQYGAMGGQYDFTKIDLSFSYYRTIYKDLFDRKTVFLWHAETGFIPWGHSVFFERFYAGGIGSLRGFTYQGVSPRVGPLLDPVGGNFLATTTEEINFPIYEKLLRGVVFVDTGDVESNVHLGQIRMDAGFGFRITIPFLGSLPLGVDFAYPFLHGPQDHIEYVSFALGVPM